MLLAVIEQSRKHKTTDKEFSRDREVETRRKNQMKMLEGKKITVADMKASNNLISRLNTIKERISETHDR